jgi:hypothetical protein
MSGALDTASSTGRTLTGTWLGLAFTVIALGVGAPASSAAADRPDRKSAHGPFGVAERPVGIVVFSAAPGPRIHGALSDRSIRNLRLGFSLAREAVRATPPCELLFATLGASGVESLAATHYAATTNRDRAHVCAGGVAALTTVSGRVTWLCPEFGNLHPRAAALTLIHEALHSAGMPEGPATVGALTAGQINDLVEGSCAPGFARRGAEVVVAARP